MPCRTTAAAGRRDSAALAADSQAQSVHPSRLPVHDPGLQALLWAQPECMLHPGQVYSCPAARRVLPDWLQVHVSQLPSVHVESPCKIAWCDASHCCLELTHAGCISLLKSAGVSRPPLIVCSSSRNVDRIACASIRGVRTCRQYQGRLLLPGAADTILQLLRPQLYTPGRLRYTGSCHHRPAPAAGLQLERSHKLDWRSCEHHGERDGHLQQDQILWQTAVSSSFRQYALAWGLLGSQVILVPDFLPTWWRSASEL